MFRFHKPLDIITLFHKASSPTSIRVAAALRQASAAASETSTEDQATSDHTTTAQSQSQQAVRRPEFKLEVTETPPTVDQLRTILDYVGKARVGSVVRGAGDREEALRRFGEDGECLRWPVAVDWNNGKVAAENESEILKMLNDLPK